jgi:hypothetical protein
MRSLKIIEAIGATLTIVGSFLPWENGGGIAGSIANGIRVELANFKYWVTGIISFPVYDYGGGLVILLTLATVFLVLRPPRFIRNPILWNLIISAALMVSSLFFMGRGIVHLYEARSWAEPPTLMSGLVLVVLGSVLLLWRAVITYRRAKSS